MRSQAEWDMPRPQLASLKTMPHATEAEQSVLGGLLLDNQAWFQIADLIVEGDFYHRNHALIFRSISALSAQNIPFDVITVSDWLEKQKLLSTAGGFEYLVNVARNTPSAANIATYAEIVRECSVLRQLNRVGTEITESTFDAQNRSPGELLEDAEKKIFAIAEQTNRKGGFLPIRQILTKAIDKIDELFQKNTSITGISSGFSDLDDKTAGLQPSDLIIIAGRPSMGKCFGKGTPILMYSGEIKPVEEIQVGDLLMGNDSTPRKVLSLARGQEKMYWIRQNKGIDYRVNESHILSLKHDQNKNVVNISLTDYFTQTLEFQSSYKGYKSNEKLDKSDIQVEYDKIDDYYGFVCDGNRLFLLEDMTVVHNTSFAMNIAENVAVGSQLPVAVFSLEMPGEQLAMRLIASLGRIDQQKVRTGRLEDDDWPRLTMAINMLAETKLFIDDTPGVSPSEIRARARRLVREEGQLGLIVIDYLQLMQLSGGKENRATEISEISRALKSLAKELQVPVIALSQLNRGVEHRQDKRPQLADLRESGAIEQDADLVMFIYRDEVYDSESQDKGTAEIIIAKQRNGPIGMVRLAFRGQFTRFENFAAEQYYSEE